MVEGLSNAVFSVRERDRRWATVRQLMAREGVDVLAVLPCSNSHNRGAADALYLTQLGEGADETIVVFPMEGEPTAWLSRGGVGPSSNWFTDIRPATRGTGGRVIIDRIKELGFQCGTIGIPGLTGGLLAHCRENEGEVNWQSVEMIKQAFPNASVGSATELLGEARFQKSDEEVELLRKGTLLGEKIIQTILDCARPGVPERQAPQQMKDVHQVMFDTFNRALSFLKAGMTVGDVLEIGSEKAMGVRVQPSLSIHGRGTGDDGPLVVGPRVALPIRSAPSRKDGSRSLQPGNVPHRITGRARPPASSRQPSTLLQIWPISSR